jgi:hypothetical protein
MDFQPTTQPQTCRVRIFLLLSPTLDRQSSLWGPVSVWFIFAFLSLYEVSRPFGRYVLGFAFFISVQSAVLVWYSRWIWEISFSPRQAVAYGRELRCKLYARDESIIAHEQHLLLEKNSYQNKTIWCNGTSRLSV